MLIRKRYWRLFPKFLVPDSARIRSS